MATVIDYDPETDLHHVLYKSINEDDWIQLELLDDAALGAADAALTPGVLACRDTTAVALRRSTLLT